MVVFVENPPSDFNWRRQIVFAALGLAASLGLGIALRLTSLSPATISFVRTLPLWFLLTLGSPMAGPHLRASVRFARAAAYAMMVNVVFFLVMRTAS